MDYQSHIAKITCLFQGLDESPHWLASMNKKEQALAVLQRMARINRVDESKPPSDIQPKEDEKVAKEEIGMTAKDSFWRIWRHKRLVIRFLVFSYAW